METAHQQSATYLGQLKTSKSSVDKVNQFGLISPELCDFFNKLGDYYWAFIITRKFKVIDFLKHIKVEMEELLWIDKLQRKLMLRKRDLPKTIVWFKRINKQQYNDKWWPKVVYNYYDHIHQYNCAIR